MKREERLAKIAREFYETNQEEKATKDKREKLRQEFFRLHDAGFGHNHILPVKTVEVPQSFFDKTGLSEADFIKRRYPGWVVEHGELNIATGTFTFVLKRDLVYIAGGVELEIDGQNIRVAKEVSEYSPEIDWETLQKERPDLYDAITKEVTVIELDEDKFADLVAQQPEELDVVERHLTVKQPSLKATTRVVKDD